MVDLLLEDPLAAPIEGNGWVCAPHDDEVMWARMIPNIGGVFVLDRFPQICDINLSLYFEEIANRRALVVDKETPDDAGSHGGLHVTTAYLTLPYV